MPKLNTYIKKFQRVDIGSMNSRIFIYDRNIAPPRQGGISFTEIFTPKLECWASIETTRGVTIFDRTNIERAVSHRFYIRNILPMAYVEPVVFLGVGLSDLSFSGTFVSGYKLTYLIKISSVGATDAFEWSTDNGTTWSSEILITGAAQLLSNGLSITFAATSGHTLNDSWSIVANAGVKISSQDWIYYVNQFMNQTLIYDILEVENLGEEGRYLVLPSNLRGDSGITTNYS